MKHACYLFLCLLLCAALSVSAVAASCATALRGDAAIGQDGSCAVSIQLTLHLEETATELTFPLPAGAEDVLLGGNYVTTHVKDDRVLVQLPNLTAGDYQFTLTYRLNHVVSRENEATQVQLPLLCGFDYPVQTLAFSITLPGPIAQEPQFISGYHQENIRSAITATISGNTLSAVVNEPLKDHETLAVIIPTDAAYFPQVSNLEPLLDTWDVLVLCLSVLAILYYLLTMLPRFPSVTRRFNPPNGISAGEVGVCLTGTGVDLTLMVLTWAQLGYLQLEVVTKRKVLLHKKMDMGNERSHMEAKAFQALFARRDTVDGSDLHYARLCRKMALQTGLSRQLFQPRSGKPLIFRLLTYAAGCFSGIKMGLALTDHPAGQVLLTVLICVLCTAFSYFIQAGGKCLPLRNKLPLLLAVGCSAVWIGLGCLTGCLAIALPMVIFQLICGFGVAFGGRRSEIGKRSLAQILGLRRYMCNSSHVELQQRLESNENYFYELAPYALALGVDKGFARRFGKAKLPECGFIRTRQVPITTASQYAALLRQVANALNARQKRLPYEQLTHR